MNRIPTRYALFMVLPLLSPAAFGGEAQTPPASAANAAGAQQKDDVIASVGDQLVTFGEINTMLNSSAIVGLSIPALGTPERDTVRIALLDKVISANLLYLDALKKGLDKDPVYQADLRRYSDAMLASLYRERYLVGPVQVSEQDILDFYRKSVDPATELTDEVRRVIEASIREQRTKMKSDTLRERLREGVEVVINAAALAPGEELLRSESDAVASIDGTPIAWGEVSALLDSPADAGSAARRVEVLNAFIDARIMSARARATAMEQDPVYVTRFNEFRKTRLINYHRAALARSMEPGEDELRTYFEANRNDITEPEVRKVQMVVLATREEAQDIKAQIESGELTLYQAAADHSIAPGAKQNLGEIGWVARGTAFPELDQVLFSLTPGETGGPVQSPAGWHLVSVLDVRDAQYEKLEDQETRKLTRRRLIHDKLDDYVVKLRTDAFPVQVREDVIIRLAQQEADLVAQLSEKAKDPASVTQKRLEEMKALMKP